MVRIKKYGIVRGIYVGYRWYDSRHIEPFYPFGYGLSYTNFAITDVKIPEEVNMEKENINVQVTVKNTGTIAGSEVVQLYVHDMNCKFDRPEKELKGFCKVYLEPGESKNITLQIKKADIAGYYVEWGEWITQPGVYEIMIGTSARDIVKCQKVNVRCKDPFGLSGKTAIGELVKDIQAVEIVNRIIEDDIHLLAHVALEFAPDKSFEELWKGTNIQGAMIKKGWSEELMKDKYQQIMDEFDKC